MRIRALPSELAVVHELDADTWAPHGARLVWNPCGQARLRTAYGTISKPQPAYGGPGYREVFLLMDDTPLIRRQSTGCPTCAQLLQLGLGSPQLAADHADVINQLTCRDYLNSGTSHWLDALRPLLELLPPRGYLLHLSELYPTDGQGHFFWSAYRELGIAEALSYRVGVPVPSHAKFLVPTQTIRSFRVDALARAEEEFEEKPGIALELSGVMAALLDGHHRALAAARAGRPFPCLTIAPYWPADYTRRDTELNVPRKLRRLIFEWHRDQQFSQDAVDERTTERLCQLVEQQTPTELPEEVRPGDLSSVYPTFDEAVAVSRVAANGEFVTDRDIEELLSGGRMVDEEVYPYRDVGEPLLEALAMSSHSRSVEVAMQIARDVERVAAWPAAYQVLARHPSETVDDFFVEMLVGDVTDTRPQLKQIMDDYFRQRGNNDA